MGAWDVCLREAWGALENHAQAVEYRGLVYSLTCPTNSVWVKTTTDWALCEINLNSITKYVPLFGRGNVVNLAQFICLLNAELYFWVAKKC